MVHILEREQLVPRRRSEVFPFFAEPRNLERLTPPELRFAILTPGPIEMRAGTVVQAAIVRRQLEGPDGKTIRDLPVNIEERSLLTVSAAKNDAIEAFVEACAKSLAP